MTNAEKLAKDTDFMTNALFTYCGDGTDCLSCKFYCGCCKIGCDTGFRRKQTMKKWLESEAED